jgi:hypothetical protein
MMEWQVWLSRDSVSAFSCFFKNKKAIALCFSTCHESLDPVYFCVSKALLKKIKIFYFFPYFKLIFFSVFKSF